MHKTMIGKFGFISMPSYETPADGGGGGAAPIGTEPSGGGTPTPAEPSIIDVDDNALIRVKGSEKPVKFGDHVKGFQSQFTKASQEAARLKSALQEREARIQQFERERQQAAQRQNEGQNQGQGNDMLAQLRELPYLSGEQAVGVVQAISQQIQQRDQILLGALKTIQKLQGVVGGLHESHSTSAFDGKINRWLTEGDYPPEIADWAKEVYLAYEGDDLDSQFPEILRSRWEQLNKVMEGRKAAQVAAARKSPFVPGRGGNANPSKPLEIKGDSSSRDLADQLFGMFAGSDT